MCGIAGFAAIPPVAGTSATTPPAMDASALTALTRALSHRGPDGAGHSLVGRVGLAHTRLAIIDLSGGDQPLFAGPATLIANGEIYNDLSLRAAMPDIRFSTGSDCEPPLHLWLRDGVRYVDRLRGMYAIAIHERGTNDLTLSRDPFGIKPLYFAELDTGVVFASEPQALLDSRLVPRGAVRPESRDELLQLQFTTGRDTIFPGIRRVLPGETIRVAGGRIIDRTRRDPLPAGPAERIGEAEALSRLDRALEESVSLHQRADVPCGLFLSGGVDSASVLALMRRLGNGRVNAFTATFDVPEAANESAAAARLARAAGARHEVLHVDEAAVWRHLPEIVAALDDPVADYAVIPTWLLARRARGDVKVILSGEGGDELFAGYGRYRSAMRPWWRGGRAPRSRGILDGLDLLRPPPRGRRTRARDWRAGLSAAEGQAGQGRDRLSAAQAADVAEWLPNDLLLKLDRCLMAHGIEGRTPMLDPAVAEAAFRLPDGLKVRGRTGKWLLRRWLQDQLPEADAMAPKQGFTVPVGAWIARQGERLAPLVANQPGLAEAAEPDRVAALFRSSLSGRRDQRAAWTLLFYALWHRIHVENRAPAGDVFEMLAG
ncbi:MAG: asparagine synthase (glutamine-hydrolyzing) [Gluconacetobacter diazotrophicus]|nr:asparagine synthase (glutamine-hydrolyzing) [Gluconacetobacter diazotrophicus]